MRSKSKPTRLLPNGDFPFSPETYPGQRPRFSFLFTNRGIYRFAPYALGRVLEDRGLAPVGSRYAVLAYGSNACPTQLLRKFSDENSLTNIPVVFGRLGGAEAVYARRQTLGGYVPATLAKRAGSGPSWLTLLTAEQVQAMDRSEGRPTSYALAKVPDLAFHVGQLEITPLYSYVDIKGGVMVWNGRPVRLRAVRQKRCQSLFDLTEGNSPHKWLRFVEINAMQPPTEPATILRR
jgi:hypothetical protein